MGVPEILFLIMLIAPVFMFPIMFLNSEGNSTTVVNQKEGWICPKEEILVYGQWSFEFGGFPNEKTLLFYERYDEGNHPVYLQIIEGKEMKMVVDGDIIVVTEVDKENNRIKVKMQEKEGW